jgi:hypothetical protein
VIDGLEIHFTVAEGGRKARQRQGDGVQFRPAGPIAYLELEPGAIESEAQGPAAHGQLAHEIVGSCIGGIQTLSGLHQATRDARQPEWGNWTTARPHIDPQGALLPRVEGRLQLGEETPVHPQGVEELAARLAIMHHRGRKFARQPAIIGDGLREQAAPRHQLGVLEERAGLKRSRSLACDSLLKTSQQQFRFQGVAPPGGMGCLGGQAKVGLLYQRSLFSLDLAEQGQESAE